MSRTKFPFRFIRLAGLGICLVALSGGAGAVFRSHLVQPTVRFETEGKFHRITVPVLDEQLLPACEYELGRYIAAVANLRTAQQLADEAYADYYRCLTGEDPPPPPPDPTPNPSPEPEPEPEPNPNPMPAGSGLDATFSILEK